MTGDLGEGIGIAGSSFNTHQQSYPAVPYSETDFNSKEKCGTSSWNIESYEDVNQVRNCRLVSLLDIDQSKEWVRQKIKDYLNKLISYGVAGFRIDGAKHMWPEDLNYIFDSLDDLPRKFFGDGKRPFIFMEVIDNGGEAISKFQYNYMGRVTEFKYCNMIGEIFRGWNGQKLSYLKSFAGKDWEMLSTGDAWAFVDNHDNQREFSVIITFWEPRLYKIANAFMLAWPYGLTKVMSSYYWYPREDNWIGPPSDAQGNTNDIPINDDTTCGGGWVCEHRWRQIKNMVGFRKTVADTYVEYWSDNGNNQITFSRGIKGFIAINNEVSGTMSGKFYTGLPEGEYCDVISGEKSQSGESQYCTGNTIVVDLKGYSVFAIESWSEDPIIAIHVNQKLETSPPPPVTPPPIASDFRRTVIFMKYVSNVGEDLFIRGGISHSYLTGKFMMQTID